MSTGREETLVQGNSSQQRQLQTTETGPGAERKLLTAKGGRRDLGTLLSAHQSVCFSPSKSPGLISHSAKPLPSRRCGPGQKQLPLYADLQQKGLTLLSAYLSLPGLVSFQRSAGAFLLLSPSTAAAAVLVFGLSGDGVCSCSSETKPAGPAMQVGPWEQGVQAPSNLSVWEMGSMAGDKPNSPFRHPIFRVSRSAGLFSGEGIVQIIYTLKRDSSALSSIQFPCRGTSECDCPPAQIGARQEQLTARLTDRLTLLPVHCRLVPFLPSALSIALTV